VQEGTEIANEVVFIRENSPSRKEGKTIRWGCQGRKGFCMSHDFNLGERGREGLTQGGWEVKGKEAPGTQKKKGRLQGQRKPATHDAARGAHVALKGRNVLRGKRIKKKTFRKKEKISGGDSVAKKN